MAALGWLLNLDFAGSGVVAAPTDTIARSRMLHFAHHALFLALVVGAAVWA
jgi:hypothetical protein